MRKWLALGVAVVGVAWGPYLYTELAPRKGAARESQLMAATEAAEPIVKEPVAPELEAPKGEGSAPANGAEGEVPAASDSALGSAAVRGEGPGASERDTPAASNRAEGANAAPSDDGSRGPGPANAAEANAAHSGEAPRGPGPANTAEANAARSDATAPNRPRTPSANASGVAIVGSTAPQEQERPRPSADTARPSPERARSFHGAFDGEQRDGSWADEQEPGIRQLMAAAGVAPDDLADVACRRTVCKLTFKSSQLSPEVLTALQARIQAEFGDSLLETHDPQSDRPAQLYLLRSGSALEAPRAD